MKFSPSPYPSAPGVLLRWPLAPPAPSECPTAYQTMPDSFICSLREPDAGDFGGLWDYLLASPDLERPSVTTLRGRPLLERRSPGEAFRSPSSLEEDPPKTNSVEKGYDPNCKTYASVIIFRSNVRYFYY